MRIVSKRRRIEGKTNYAKRIRMLEGKKPRIIARKTNNYIILQYVESKFAQDAVKLSVTSKELLGYGWPEEKSGSLKSLGAAYLSGLLLGKKVKSKLNTKEQLVLDTGLIRSTKGSRIYAAVKGMIDAGLKVSCSEEVFP